MATHLDTYRFLQTPMIFVTAVFLALIAAIVFLISKGVDNLFRLVLKVVELIMVAVVSIAVIFIFVSFA